jgi:uncharacterized protein YbjT (DUF2867 family)
MKRVLILGATGFVGHRLAEVLERSGVRVVGTSRNPAQARRAMPGRTFLRVDVGDFESVRSAMEGCDAAYFLVHGMADGKGYEEREALEAENVARAAAEAGLERIVYLGGPRPHHHAPSRHLRSRLRTGEILREGQVPALELRATMIIGGGGESWRIVRDLAARLPAMLLPKWLESRSEPVAIVDVVFALAKALEIPLEASRALDLPGPEILSAAEMLARTAGLMNSAPPMIRVPVITPRLSSYWIRLVTRANPHVATELVEGLRFDLISEGPSFWDLAPEHERMGFDQAARLALAEEEQTVGVAWRSVEHALRALGRALPTKIGAQ